MEEEKARQEKSGQGSSSPQKKSTAMEEDPELAAALAMSMGQEPTEDTPMLTEDEELARALALSMADNVLTFN
jgi:hypothetical protein